MGLTEEGNGMVMPVQPLYGNGGGGYGLPVAYPMMGGGYGGNGFGGDIGSIIVLFIIASIFGGNGFGGFGGGYGANALGYDFPWLLNGQQNINANTNNGFRDAMINDNITSVRDGISALSTQLCGCCGDMQMALANGFAGVEQGANARQMANMQTQFDLSRQLSECCCENRLATAQTQALVQSENCADREALSNGIRDIIANQTAGTQRILDQLCNDKIDSKNEKILELQNALNMATLRESQVAQNAFIQQGFANEVDQLYNRLNNCPVPSTPVYGRTPIFQCNQNSGCGCGCGNF